MLIKFDHLLESGRTPFLSSTSSPLIQLNRHLSFFNRTNYVRFADTPVYNLACPGCIHGVDDTHLTAMHMKEQHCP